MASGHNQFSVCQLHPELHYKLHHPPQMEMGAIDNRDTGNSLLLWHSQVTRRNDAPMGWHALAQRSDTALRWDTVTQHSTVMGHSDAVQHCDGTQWHNTALWWDTVTQHCDGTQRCDAALWCDATLWWDTVMWCIHTVCWQSGAYLQWLLLFLYLFGIIIDSGKWRDLTTDFIQPRGDVGVMLMEVLNHRDGFL